MAEYGIIGLGNMGLPMAANLVKAGHHVLGHDKVAQALAKAGAAGVEIAGSAAEAAANREILVTMLPDGKIVLDVFAQIAKAAKPGTVIIESSTIDVSSAMKAHRMAADAGLLCVDAPVSGGVGGAEAGTLTFMVGGTDEAFGKARPALEIMGGRIVHCGGAGAGQSAKICNNMLLGISMIGACEAFALAERLGLSQEALFDVISTSSGSCWSVNSYCPVPGVGPKSPADNNYRPGFAAAFMLKDLGLAQEAAAAAGAPTPMGAHARKLYEAFVGAGNGGTDFSGIIRYLETLKRDTDD
jgi:3-hydroxyisobutyrate dehydrogenase